MSTKIFDAWRVPTQDMAQLLELGREVKAIQNKHNADEIARNAKFPCHKKAAAALAENDGTFFSAARVLKTPINEVLGMMKYSSVWALEKGKKEYLSLRITQEMKDAGITLSKEAMDAVIRFCVDIAEVLCKSEQSLLFIPGDEGSTYVKGFGLTDEVTHYMDELYQPFQYTDQCEMDARDFSAEVQTLYEEASSEEERHDIIARAQEERGNLWNQAFGKNCLFADIGFKFSLESYAVSKEAVIQAVIIKRLKTALEE